MTICIEPPYDHKRSRSTKESRYETAGVALPFLYFERHQLSEGQMLDRHGRLVVKPAGEVVEFKRK